LWSHAFAVFNIYMVTQLVKYLFTILCLATTWDHIASMGDQDEHQADGKL